MSNLVGRTLGQYEILAEIGHGGMANVYRATQRSVGREVAIKVLPAHLMQERTFLERFNREVKVIAKLQHPRILPVYDYGEAEGIPYIVMAYLTGGTLADRIRRHGALPFDEIAKLIRQMAEGLDYAHAQGVIHRDFKPSNVLLDGVGNAYLADFGIAKVTQDTTQLTGSGMIGTPAYMAPELARPGNLSPLVDVYAMGVTLYQMIAGELPFWGDTPIGVMMAHATEPIPNARALRPDLPDAVQRVIERTLAKDPAARYPTPGAVAASLDAALRGAPRNDPPTLPDDGSTMGMAQGQRAAGVVGVAAPRFDPTTAPAANPAAPIRAGGPPLIILAGVGAAVFALIACAAVVAFFLFFNKPVAVATPPPTKAPILQPTATALPPTPLPTPTLIAPAFYNFRFCATPCQDGGASRDTFPERISDVYYSFDYENMKRGLAYTRTWINRSETWVVYNCVWQGGASGTFNKSLFDHGGGLRSGVWTVILAIEGKEVASASLTVEGSSDYWRPFGNDEPCPDW